MRIINTLSRGHSSQRATDFIAKQDDKNEKAQTTNDDEVMTSLTLRQFNVDEIIRYYTHLFWKNP